MRGSVGALPRPTIYAIKKPKGLGGEYQFAGADADWCFGSAFAADSFSGAAQLLSLDGMSSPVNIDTPNIMGCFVSITKSEFGDDEQGREFRSYIWGQKGICDTLKQLNHKDYGNDLVLILFQFYVNPLPIQSEGLKEIESYRKKEKSIGISIVVNDENFFNKPEKDRHLFLRQSILRKLGLLSEVISRRKLDTKIDLLKSDLERIYRGYDSAV
jgi:hypothetical protein